MEITLLSCKVMLRSSPKKMLGCRLEIEHEGRYQKFAILLHLKEDNIEYEPLQHHIYQDPHDLSMDFDELSILLKQLFSSSLFCEMVTDYHYDVSRIQDRDAIIQPTENYRKFVNQRRLPTLFEGGKCMKELTENQPFLYRGQRMIVETIYENGDVDVIPKILQGKVDSLHIKKEEFWQLVYRQKIILKEMYRS